MSITYEFFFQILNTILCILIPIAIYGFIKNYRKNRIFNLEKKVNDLEKKVNNLEIR